MFDNITTGQTVTLKMQGSTQGLAMRATAEQDAECWALGNGRRLFAVEA